jgi:GDP-4-dehydro-6-deoxy-D-mannose reductase
MRNFKKVFITGICGSGGSFLAEYIVNKFPNIEICGIYRKKKFSNIKNIKNKIKIYKCDLNSYPQIKILLKKIKPCVIFHLASNADVRMSFDYPKDIINNNNNCTLNLLESIRTLKIDPVVMICSTSEVYGIVNKKNIPINENCPLNPASPYAVSKTFQDILAQTYFKNYKLKIIITRMFSYFNSRRENLFSSNWANQIAKIERGEQRILYHGNLNSVRTIIGINDAMEAYWKAAILGSFGEIYNIGGGTTLKISKILSILKSKSKIKIISKIDKALLRKTDVTLQIPDCKKFAKQCEWIPRENFDNSVQNLLDDFRKK